MNKQEDITYLLYKNNLYYTKTISCGGGYYRLEIIGGIPPIMYYDYQKKSILDKVYKKFNNYHTYLTNVFISDISDDIILFSYSPYTDRTDISVNATKKFREYYIKDIIND